MIALRIVLGAAAAVFGGAWLLTARAVTVCASGLGQFEQAISQRDASTCGLAGLIHGATGLLALAAVVGLAIALAVRS